MTGNDSCVDVRCPRCSSKITLSLDQKEMNIVHSRPFFRRTLGSEHCPYCGGRIVIRTAGGKIDLEIPG